MVSFRDHKQKLDDCARGHWEEILPSLGVPTNVVDKKTRKAGYPCPRCGGKDRFSFTDKWERGDAHCRTCGHLDGYAVAEAYGTSFMETIAHLEERFGLTRDRVTMPSRPPEVPYHEKVWSQSRPIKRGDPAAAYLAARGLTLATLPSCLRYHPNLVYEEEGEGTTVSAKYPALVALITLSGKPIGLQRIYLDGHGGKAPVSSPKKGLGKVNQGGAVALRQHQGHLGVAEGIETAEACFELFNIPTWALVTAGNLAKFDLPDGVDRLTIFGDVDQSFTGQQAVFALAQKYCKKVKVEIQWPANHVSAPSRDVDFLDVLVRAKAVAVQH